MSTWGLAVDAIVVEDLVKTCGRTGALDGVSLTVAEDSKLGLLGPNSAGKTTAVRALCTLLRPAVGATGQCPPPRPVSRSCWRPGRACG